jgi:hypothetical protein
MDVKDQAAHFGVVRTSQRSRQRLFLVEHAVSTTIVHEKRVQDKIAI